ncbi:MAG: PP2C family protein-serine/threonine phosphatase [Phycisphaerales bacterium]|nr:PP2C family protein-serine/threonine phosphatase [Phycisphaerales bacterium]
MKFLDVSQNPFVLPAVDLQRELSRVRTGDESVQSVMSRIGEVSPVRYLVNVSVKGLAPGEYRVSEKGTIASRFAGRSEQRALRTFSADPRALPIRRGGFIASVIADEQPKVIHHLSITGDPALGDEVAACGSCLVTPVFEDGQVTEWLLAFHAGAEEAQVEQLRIAIPNANLLTRTAKQLDLIAQVRDLNARLRRQLQEVASVQQSLLPRETPDIPGLKIATSYLTSDEAGGDYYDFLRLPDGRWGVLIADVSGHGAAAATVMAMLHAILHGYESRAFEPAPIMEYANRRLVGARLEGTFITAFLGIYDPVTGRVDYTRAGHHPPRVKRGAGGGVAALEGGAAPPLGVFDALEAEQARFEIAPMDTVVLYTDGITEAFSPDRRMFGEAGLDAALITCTGDPDCVVDSVHGALYAHTHSRKRADDQTIVAMRRLAGA